MNKNGAAHLQLYLFWWYCKEGSSADNIPYTEWMEVEKRSGTQINISGSTITIILVPKTTEDEHIT